MTALAQALSDLHAARDAIALDIPADAAKALTLAITRVEQAALGPITYLTPFPREVRELAERVIANVAENHESPIIVDGSNVSFPVHIETDDGEESWTVNVDIVGSPSPSKMGHGIEFNWARRADGRQIEIRDEFEVYAGNHGNELDLHGMAFDAAHSVETEVE